MGNGRSPRAPAQFFRPAGILLAGLVVPLVLLVGPAASAWHEDHHAEHGDEPECAVCHSGHQTVALPRLPALVWSQATERLLSVREVRRVVSRRELRRPARAPPA